MKDFFSGDRIVIGSDSDRATQTLKALYAPLNTKILVIEPKSAEMIKYASSTFLAPRYPLLMIFQIYVKRWEQMSERLPGA